MRNVVAARSISHAHVCPRAHLAKRPLVSFTCIPTARLAQLAERKALNLVVVRWVLLGSVVAAALPITSFAYVGSFRATSNMASAGTLATETCPSVRTAHTA